MTRTHAQQVSLALFPKLSSALSIFGSLWIVIEVARDRKKWNVAYHRLLLAVSILDLLVSSAWFMSTWPIPSDADGLFGNIGNEATCHVQGFFIQMFAGSPFYNSFLALYFVLVIRYGWTEKRIRRVEPFVHAVAITMALGTASISSGLGLLGNAHLWCWIEESHYTYRMFFFYIWYWSSLIVVATSMLIVYWTVRAQEAASQEFSIRAKRKNTGKVGTQAMLYTGAYFLTSFFSTISCTMQAFRGAPAWALIGMTVFYPMQGFLNFIIYIRPRYLRYKNDQPRQSRSAVLIKSLRRVFDSFAQDDNDYKLGTAEDQPSAAATMTSEASPAVAQGDGES